MTRVERTAPAKVNFGLAVLARRGDGYHQIDTLLAALELHDTVTAETIAEGIELTVEHPGGAGFGGGVPEDARNLAWRAAERFLRAAAPGTAGGVRLHLVKRVPVAAGLGGGSSDAAATLAALAELYPDAGVELDALAPELGSDVPFFVAAATRGWNGARARGRGERLSQARLPEVGVVLLNPGIPVSAGDAYGALQNFSARPDWHAIREALAGGDRPRWVNALQPGVLLEHGEIRGALAALREAPGVRGALMSGSGSTCFGVTDPADASGVAERLAAEHPDWWVAASRVRRPRTAATPEM